MLIVHTTFAKRGEAEKAAATIIKERLAACASVFPVKSFFIWKGEFTAQREFVLELKINDGSYQKAEKRILSLHSYSLPQIIAFEVKRGSREYLQWAQMDAKVKKHLKHLEARRQIHAY